MNDSALQALGVRLPGRSGLRVVGPRRDRRTARLDQRRLRGARDRARARAQPRHLARRRALLHGLRRAGADGRLVHDRPDELRPAAVRRSVRRDGQLARAAADEHGAQAGARRCSRRPPCRRSAPRARISSLPWRRSARRWSCSACRSPAAASYFVEYRWPDRRLRFAGAGSHAACSSTPSRPTWSTRISTDHGDSDTALVDMHPDCRVPLEPVDERGHERRSGLRRPGSRHLDPEHRRRAQAVPRWPSRCRPTRRRPAVRAG